MENVTRKRTIVLLACVLIVGLLAGLFISGCSAESKPEDDTQKIAEICEKTEKKCINLLKNGDYDRLPALYDSVSAYPEAVALLDQKLKVHVATAMENLDHAQVVRIYNALSDVQAINAVVQEGMREGADRIWEDSYIDYMVFYQALKRENLHLELLDEYVRGYIVEQLERDDYTFTFTYFDLITHCEECMTAVHDAFLARMKLFLFQGEYDMAGLVYHFMSLYEMDITQASQTLHDYAYELMEQEKYADAQECFYMMRDEKDPLYDQDAQYMLRLSTLHLYLLDGQFDTAKDWVDMYAGQTREKLLEVFLEYSADRKVIADLETALLVRMDMAQSGATDREQIDAELEALRQYRNIGFYDETLKQLVMDYLDAVEEQRDALYYDQNGRDYYKYYYYWNLETAKSYMILDTLHRDYGFASDNARLQALLGIGEGMQQWITAWYEIHNCLSGQLWDVEPVFDGVRYCLEVRNDTAYTFDLTVYERIYGADGALLRESASGPITVTPGECIRIPAIDPEDCAGDRSFYWQMDAIYHDGVLLE